MEKDMKNELKPKELSEEELEKISGGENYSLHFCDSEEEVVFIFSYYSHVKVKKYFFSKTVNCIVVDYKPFYDPQYHCYTDIYHVKTTDYKEGDFYYLNDWVSRDDIVNVYAD